MKSKSSLRVSANIYPTWLDLKPSRCFSAALLLTHAILLTVISQLDFSLWAQAILCVMCIFSLAWSVRYHALRTSAHAVIRIWQEEGGDWLLMDRGGHTFRGQLRGDSFIGQHLVILNFKIEAHRLIKPVVLFFDALANPEFRRLRVYLISNRKSIED